MAVSEKTKQIRSFIAVDLPPVVKDTLAAVQQQLTARRFKVRWVDSRNIHITLKFLGDVDITALADIEAALIRAMDGRPGFALSAGGLGAFPGIKRPKILWAGIRGQVDRLRQIQQAVEEAMVPLGFETERRPFKAHLTLGRVKGPVDGRRLADALQACGPFETETFSVDRISLFESRLQPTGAVYRRLTQVTLTSPMNLEEK